MCIALADIMTSGFWTWSDHFRRLGRRCPVLHFVQSYRQHECMFANRQVRNLKWLLRIFLTPDMLMMASGARHRSGVTPTPQ
jgi:hypothetical protein